MKWDRLAAEQGNTSAQLHIGVNYLVSGDFVQAVKWYRLAAEQEDALAQSALGQMYEFGWGVSRSGWRGNGSRSDRSVYRLSPA